MDRHLQAHVYATEHVNSKTVCTAFAEGARLPLVPPQPIRPGAVIMYGYLRGLWPTLRQAKAEGRAWLYLDNGYIRPGHFHGFYRATWCAYQHSGLGKPDFDRLKALDIDIRPWRKGRHVLVCPPGDAYAEHHGFTAKGWLKETLATLKASTDREIVVRPKGTPRPLADDLADAHALVTHASNTAVDAALFGVPAFVNGPSPARALGNTDLREIERPVYGPREEWAAVLAANQWSIAEMRAGTCWRQLLECLPSDTVTS